jgi:hypothetical protein
MKSIAVALLALAFPAQIPKEPAKDLFMHTLRAPGIEVRFVDYHWQPALFDAMEKGTTTVPEARRNWVIARVVLDQRALKLRGTALPFVQRYVAGSVFIGLGLLAATTGHTRTSTS